MNRDSPNKHNKVFVSARSHMCTYKYEYLIQRAEQIWVVNLRQHWPQVVPAKLHFE